MIELLKTKSKFILRKKSERRCEVCADPESIQKLAGLGLDEKEIAGLYSVTPKQFNTAKKRYKLIADAMERGKDAAAKQVMEALFKRATGYEQAEIEYTRVSGKVTACPVIRYYPPDMRAIEFWLKNRTPLKWKAKVDYNLKLKEDELQKLRELAADAMKRLL